MWSLIYRWVDQTPVDIKIKESDGEYNEIPTIQGFIEHSLRISDKSWKRPIQDLIPSYSHQYIPLSYGITLDNQLLKQLNSIMNTEDRDPSSRMYDPPSWLDWVQFPLSKSQYSDTIIQQWIYTSVKNLITGQIKHHLNITVDQFLIHRNDTGIENLDQDFLQITWIPLYEGERIYLPNEHHPLFTFPLSSLIGYRYINYHILNPYLVDILAQKIENPSIDPYLNYSKIMFDRAIKRDEVKYYQGHVLVSIHPRYDHLSDMLKDLSIRLSADGYDLIELKGASRERINSIIELCQMFDVNIYNNCLISQSILPEYPYLVIRYPRQSYDGKSSVPKATIDIPQKESSTELTQEYFSSISSGISGFNINREWILNESSALPDRLPMVCIDYPSPNRYTNMYEKTWVVWRGYIELIKNNPILSRYIDQIRVKDNKVFFHAGNRDEVRKMVNFLTHYQAPVYTMLLHDIFTGVLYRYYLANHYDRYSLIFSIDYGSDDIRYYLGYENSLDIHSKSIELPSFNKHTLGLPDPMYSPNGLHSCDPCGNVHPKPLASEERAVSIISSIDKENDNTVSLFLNHMNLDFKRNWDVNTYRQWFYSVWNINQHVKKDESSEILKLSLELAILSGQPRLGLMGILNIGSHLPGWLNQYQLSIDIPTVDFELIPWSSPTSNTTHLGVLGARILSNDTCLKYYDDNMVLSDHIIMLARFPLKRAQEIIDKFQQDWMSGKLISHWGISYYRYKIDEYHNHIPSYLTIKPRWTF